LSLKKLFYEKVKKEHSYFVFDHIDKTGPKFFSFLDNLIDDYGLLIISRRRDSKYIGNLSLLLCFFDKLEMVNLERTYARELIDYFIDVF